MYHYKLSSFNVSPVILQKPDNSQQHDGEGAPQEQPQPEKKAEEVDPATRDDEAPWKRSPVREESKTQPPPTSPPPDPPIPEHHECSKCHEVLTSLWELDLHKLETCGLETTTVTKKEPRAEAMNETMKESDKTASTSVHSDEGGEPAMKDGETAPNEHVNETKASPAEPAKGIETEPADTGKETESEPPDVGKETETSSTEPQIPTEMPITPPHNLQSSSGSLADEEKQGTKRKRGRPRKYVPSRSESPVPEKEKRKRGRPRKNTSISAEGDHDDSFGKSTESMDEDKNVEKSPKGEAAKSAQKFAVKLPTLTGARSKRKRWLPVKLREVYDDEKTDANGADDSQVHGEDVDEDQENMEQTKAEEDYDILEEEILTEKSETDEVEGIIDEDEASEITDTDEYSKEIAVMNKKCDICDKIFCSASYLTKHKMMVHSDQREYFKCSTCHKLFSLKGMFKRHLIMHQNKAKNIKFTCKVCNIYFYDKYTLSNHEKIHTKRDITCDFCDKAFAHESMMRRHRNNVHTKEVSYPCTLCDKVFYLKNRLRDHMVTHSGKKEYKCEQCGMEFFLLHRLKLHQRTVHIEGKPFLCDLCGSEFKSKSTLKQHHLTKHTDIKNYPCRQCGKPFSRTSLRNQHERVHEGRNPFPCEFCGKGFRDKFKLKVHVNWHMGVRPYSCEFCKKSFLVKGNLTKHQRLHTGERPYVCEECGRGCVDSSQLKKHMAHSHNIHMERRLTKGPLRTDGELPSRPSKRKRQEEVVVQNVTPHTSLPQTEDSLETQAYTIATDALIEISQQLAHMSNAIPGQIVVSNNMVAATNVPQEGASEVVSTSGPDPVETTRPGPDIFPVVIQVAAQDNQVSVPVTQSISAFQSLELVTLQD